jgi:hypothetical protein
MVISTRQHSEKAAAQQGTEAAIPEPSKIGACTPWQRAYVDRLLGTVRANSLGWCDQRLT